MGIKRNPTKKGKKIRFQLVNYVEECHFEHSLTISCVNAGKLCVENLAKKNEGATSTGAWLSRNQLLITVIEIDMAWPTDKVSPIVFNEIILSCNLQKLRNI